LLSLAESSTDAEFNEIVERSARRQRLLNEREKLNLQLGALRGNEEPRKFQSHLAASDEVSIQTELDRQTQAMEELTRDLREVTTEIGQLTERITSMENGRETLAIQAELENERSKLAAAVDQWAPLALAESIIEQCLARFEREHQPQMLSEVADIYTRLTRGRYRAIHRKLDEQGTLIVESERGERKSPEQLSRGAREQLYLAIRLAYVRHYSTRSEPLPLVMDDVLVNFDDHRSRATLELLGEMSSELQIIFLTCHAPMADHVLSVIPDAARIDLAPLEPALSANTVN
jgi:uncharacterized protein YhaN